MNWKRTARWSWLILPFLLLALWPSVAAADPVIPPGSNLVLYEVTENLKLKPLLANRRVATSALMGTTDAGSPICPAFLGIAKCAVTAMAGDNVSLATGKGPVVGTFSVVVQDVNTVDGPELVIMQGHFSGKIDLSPAILSGVPLGTITAKWSARGVSGGLLQGFHARGSLTGTFRLPFVFPAAGVTSPSYMLNPFTFPASGSYVPVAESELSLSEPTVRLEVNLVQSNGYSHGDSD